MHFLLLASHYVSYDCKMVFTFEGGCPEGVGQLDDGLLQHGDPPLLPVHLMQEDTTHRPHQALYTSYVTNKLLSTLLYTVHCTVCTRVLRGQFWVML